MTTEENQELQPQKQQEGKGQAVSPNDVAICKMHLDLWMHQNNLMWSRIQVLWFIQFGFLGLSTYLYTAPQALDQLNISFLAKYAALLCAITTFGLWIVMLIDKKLRDIHRINIESYDLGVHPASVWQNRSKMIRVHTMSNLSFTLVSFWCS